MKFKRRIIYHLLWKQPHMTRLNDKLQLPCLIISWMIQTLFFLWSVVDIIFLNPQFNLWFPNSTTFNAFYLKTNRNRLVHRKFSSQWLFLNCFRILPIFVGNTFSNSIEFFNKIRWRVFFYFAKPSIFVRLWSSSKSFLWD